MGTVRRRVAAAQWGTAGQKGAAGAGGTNRLCHLAGFFVLLIFCSVCRFWESVFSLILIMCIIMCFWSHVLKTSKFKAKRMISYNRCVCAETKYLKKILLPLTGTWLSVFVSTSVCVCMCVCLCLFWLTVDTVLGNFSLRPLKWCTDTFWPTLMQIKESGAPHLFIFHWTLLTQTNHTSLCKWLISPETTRGNISGDSVSFLGYFFFGK